MSYIATDNISIFPLSKERPAKRENNIFYESNIANIIRQLIDTEGFIITPPTDATDLISLESDAPVLNKSLMFNLYGYYIELSKGAVLADNATKGDVFYACIKIKDNEIDGQDNKGDYEGLSIVTDVSSLTGSEYHLLPLFEIITIDGDKCECKFIEDSYTKIQPKSFDFSIDFIDGQR